MIRELKISKQQFRSLFEFNRIVMIFFTGRTDRVKNGLLKEMQRTGTILNFNDGNLWMCQTTDIEEPLNFIRFRLLNYTFNLMKDQIYPGAQTYIDYTIVRLGLKPLADVTPLRPEYGMVVNDVTAFKYPIEIAKCRKETIANRTLFW